MSVEEWVDMIIERSLREPDPTPEHCDKVHKKAKELELWFKGR